MAVYDLASYRPLPARKKRGAPMPRRRIAVVVNGGSRSGEGRVGDAVDRLKTGGDVVSVEKTSEIDAFRDLVRQAATAADVVVIGGGDGSMSAALPFFLGDGPVLGVLPLGTANDLARTLGIPLDPAEAARIVADGQERRIDLGEVNGRPFC
ncbi:MAG: lipid kinase, partial [Alphaproteobacteria bacterium]|nr:lipid kinase [Alphaproteobacteria bacterium]